MSWLFLNARGSAEEQAASGLGNAAIQTPATAKVKRITVLIESYLMRLGVGERREAACQVALNSLVRVVKQLNKSILKAAEEGSAGADVLWSLSRRTNEYFTQLVGNWLKSDSIASHFVFELGGFEFLLDTIGKTDFSSTPHAGQASLTESKQVDHLEEGSSLVEEGPATASDIYDILYSSDTEGAVEAQGPGKADKGKPQSGVQEKEQEPPLDEPPSLVLAELAGKQQLVLTEDNSGGAVAASHSKVDWSSNKRAYKYRLIVTPLQGALRNEYWTLFKL